jgi:ribosomal protein L40E
VLRNKGGIYMSVFENFTRKVTETAKAAAKKSSDLVEVTKLNMSIGSEEDKIEKVYKEIGKIVYENYSNGASVDDVFIEKCKEIASYEDNIKEMRSKVRELKNVKLCPNCNEELELDVMFCSKCGTKQETPREEPKCKEVEGKVCPECNEANETSAMFCSKCGTKLG